MITIILKVYIALFLYFLIASLWRVRTAILDRDATRSREAKVVLRKTIERSQKEALLSLVWPVMLAKIVHSFLLSFK